MRQRGRDEGGSEGRPVMGRIEGESPTEHLNTTSPWHKSGLTSFRSSVTRGPRPTDSGRQAEMSAAEMLAGAAPGRSPDWHSLAGKKVVCAVCRLPVRIVKAGVKAAASREGR